MQNIAGIALLHLIVLDARGCAYLSHPHITVVFFVRGVSFQYVLVWMGKKQRNVIDRCSVSGACVSFTAAKWIVMQRFSRDDSHNDCEGEAR